MAEVTLQDARSHLGQLLMRASRSGESITITRYGQAEGVIISAEAYAELQELRREKDRRDLAAAVEADRRGEMEWISYPAKTREELMAGLNTALGLDE
ncbi:prevent-host-death family protein [Nocardiopsis mwathae]|uniref:Antitoxin n=1 Tax=Nocardiopsis mwathae TaxID=1472723 RepID=A0A7W9YKC1_9ACTN|nr:type II toxin-antitoxin system Phd/YefM family antitoxin [Nocardiopsis mwathae]MBB6173609.1 prevent-host-death family protein [Nocardiopsis mwathae]